MNEIEREPSSDGHRDLPSAPVGSEARANLPFWIVGIGASAGGVEALSEFFKAMPAQPSMAFVVIQHLSPDHQSLMAEILSRHTAMPVRQITDGMNVEKDHVYVIAPGFTVTLAAGRFHLGRPIEQRGHRRPVDDFFRSLAEEQKERAIIVVLSGTGTNGTAGAQAIKAAGGICIAQDPDTANFPGMPRSLVYAGYADQVLAPREIPALLLKYAAHAIIAPEEKADSERNEEREQSHLREILAILRLRTGHRFNGYKQPTLLRRMHRRMGLAGLEQLSNYAALLRDNAEEAGALANDLRIHVTGFFRDAEAWEALRTAVVRPLIDQHPGDRPLRAWVTACASGEEAYTLAMLITDELQAADKNIEVKIFATDTADRSLDLARAGVYPAGIEGDLSVELLDRFFDRDDHTYRIKKHIREMVVFAGQDLLHDPPFSHIDLCTCRNLLIYLEPDSQTRALRLMHFALHEGGYLFLGSAEALGAAEQLYMAVSKKWRIYQRVGAGSQRFAELPSIARNALLKVQQKEPPSSTVRMPDPLHSVQWALLERFGPPLAVVDRHERVVYFHGDTATFLVHPPGQPTNLLLDLVRPPLRAAVRGVLRQAIAERTTVSISHGDLETAPGGGFARWW